MGKKCRSAATLAVVLTLCACAVLEKMGGAPTPQWFIVLGTAVVTEYIVEYWQGHKDVDT